MRNTMSKDSSQEPMVAADGRPRWRSWLDLWWIFAAVVAITIAMLVAGLYGPDPPIRVSRETTYITEPLADDGLPDYHAAWMAMVEPAPASEENIVTAVMQQFRLTERTHPDVRAVRTAMGIPADPPTDCLLYPPNDASANISEDVFAEAQERPWDGTRLPDLEAWIISNQDKIDQLRAAFERPRYWTPQRGFLEGYLGKATEIVACRAMWHVRHGRHADAWRDLHAIARLSCRMVGHERGPPDFYTVGEADRLRERVNQAITSTLLVKPGMSPEVVATIARDMDALEPPPAITDVVMLIRLQMIDYLSRHFRPSAKPADRKLLYEVIEVGQRDHHRMRTVIDITQTSIDWNRVLWRLNDSYDAIDAAFRLSGYQAQKRALEQAYDGFRKDYERWKQCGQGGMIIVSREYRSQFVGVGAAKSAVVDFGDIHNGLTRSRAEFVLTRTAVALAGWELDHKPDGSGYPERLEDLVPRYLPAVPIDPFADAPLLYERHGDGYLLASVGQNGVYDGGLDMRGWIAGGEWHDTPQKVDRNECDHVIRMPVPDRPFRLSSPPFVR